MNLCVFQKASVRKVLLSERDGNPNFPTFLILQTILVRKVLLSERDGNNPLLLNPQLAQTIRQEGTSL